MRVLEAIGFLGLYLYGQFILCPLHIFYALLTGQVNSLALTRHLCTVLNISFFQSLHSHALVKSTSQSQIIYLCNHRSWADFFVDQVVCGGASYLARYMVWLGTPISSLYGWLSSSTWFFNRKRGLDRDALADVLEAYWAKRPDFGMVAYPEGTRNQEPEPLTLKTGVLYFAFKYKHPIQVVITTNKETVFNEKKCRFSLGTKIVTCASETIHPKDFVLFESFVQRCRVVFKDTWTLAHQNEDEALEYKPVEGSFLYPHSPLKINLLRLVVCIVLSILLLPPLWQRLY